MAITLGTVVIGSYIFVCNPRVESITMELLQNTSRTIGGTTVSSYISKDGDTTKIKSKKSFNISGIDPDIDQIEAIEAELESAGPISFTDALGTVYSVYVSTGLSQTVSTSTYTAREYSFALVEA